MDQAVGAGRAATRRGTGHRSDASNSPPLTTSRLTKVPAAGGPGQPVLPRPLVDPELWFRALYDTPLLLAGVADLDGWILDANHLSVEGAGFARSDVIGTLFWDGPWWGTSAPVRERVRHWCAEAASGALVRDESVWWDGNGVERHVDIAIHPVQGPTGELAHLFLSGLDITDRVAAQHAATAVAEQAAQSLQHIADERAQSIAALQAAQSELAVALQLSQDVLDNVADGIYGLDRDLKAVFVNPSATRIVGYQREQLLGQDMHALLHRLPDGAACPLTQCAALRALASGSAVTSEPETFRHADGSLIPVEVTAMPTLTNGEVNGVVISFRDLTERLAAADQAEQLRVLAEHEAIQRELSDQLQRALLTAPPSPPGLQVAVRYRAAAEQAQIGGDWYDAFVQPDGSLMLVIGDVLGHDSSAAATMAQFRGLLRGIAYGSPDSPGRMLTRFETAARGLGITALATTVLVRVDATASADGRRVTWSNAGHPPPVILHANGSVTLLRTPADLLVGIAPPHDRVDHHATLAPDSTLLLFTDGLVERRDTDLDQGLGALTAVLTDCAAASPDHVCDAVLSRLVPGGAEDDIALLGVRSASGEATAPG